MAILWSNLYLIFGKDTLLLILYKFQKIFSFLEISFISQYVFIINSICLKSWGSKLFFKKLKQL